MNQNTNPPGSKMKVLSKAALKYYPEDLIKKVESEEQQHFSIESLEPIPETPLKGPPSRKGRKRVSDDSLTNTPQSNESLTGRVPITNNQKTASQNNLTTKPKSTQRTKKRDGGVGLSATEQNVLKILAANAQELGNQKVPPITIQRSQTNINTAKIVPEKKQLTQQNIKGITNEQSKNNSPHKTIIPRTAGHPQNVSAISKASLELTPNITPNIKSNITKSDVDFVPQLAPQRNKSTGRISTPKIEPEIIRTIPKLVTTNSQTTPIAPTHLVITPPPKRTVNTPMQRIQPMRPIKSPEYQNSLKITTNNQQDNNTNTLTISPPPINLVNKQNTQQSTQSNVAAAGHSLPPSNIQVSPQQQSYIQQQLLQQRLHQQNQKIKQTQQQPSQIRVQTPKQIQKIQQQQQTQHQKIQQEQAQQQQHVKREIQKQQIQHHQFQQQQQINQQLQHLQSQQFQQQLQQQNQNTILTTNIQFQETIKKLQEQQKIKEKLLLDQKRINLENAEKMRIEEETRLKNQQKYILEQKNIIDQQTDGHTSVIYTTAQSGLQNLGTVGSNISQQNISNISNQQNLQDFINQVTLQNVTNQQNQERLLEQQRFQQETDMVREHMGRMIAANNLNQPWQNTQTVNNSELLNYLLNQFATINPQLFNQFPINHDTLQQLLHGKSDQTFQRMLIQHLVNQLHLLLNQNISPNSQILTQQQVQSTQQNQNIKDNTNVNMSNTNSEHHQQQIAYNTALNNLAAAGITDENRLRLQQEYASVIRSFQEEESKKQKAEEDKKRLEELLKKQQENELLKKEAEKQRLQAEELWKRQEAEKRQAELEQMKQIEIERMRIVEEENKRKEEEKRVEEERKRLLNEKIEMEARIKAEDEMKKLFENKKPKYDDNKKVYKVNDIICNRVPQKLEKTKNIVIETKKVLTVEEKQKKVVEDVHNKIRQEVRQQVVNNKSKKQVKNNEEHKNEENRKDVIVLHKERVLEKEKIGAFILQANQIYQLNKNCNMDEFLKLCICLDPSTNIEEKICGEKSLFKREDLLKIPPKVFLEDLSAEHRRVCKELEEEAKRLNIDCKRYPIVETISIKNNEQGIKRTGGPNSNNTPYKKPCLEKVNNSPIVLKTNHLSKPKIAPCPSTFLPPSSFKTSIQHSTVLKPIATNSIVKRDVVPPKMILVQKTSCGQLQQIQDPSTIIVPKIEKRVSVRKTTPIVLPTKVLKPILVTSKKEISKVTPPVIVKKTSVCNFKNGDKSTENTTKCKSKTISMTRSQIEERLKAFRAAANVAATTPKIDGNSTKNDSTESDSNKPGPSGVKIKLSDKDIETLINKGKPRQKTSGLEMVTKIKNKFEKEYLGDFNVELVKVEKVVGGKNSKITFENGKTETNNPNFRNGFSKKKKHKKDKKISKKNSKRRKRTIKFEENVGVHLFTPICSEDEYVEPPIPVTDQVIYVEELIKKVIFNQNTSQKQKNEALVRLNSRLEDKQYINLKGVDENDILKDNFITELVSSVIQFKKKLTLLDKLTEEVNEEMEKLPTFSDSEKLKHKFKLIIKNELLKLDEERKRNTYDRLKSKKIDKLNSGNVCKDDLKVVDGTENKSTLPDIPDDVDLRKEDLQCHELIDGKDVTMEDSESTTEKKNIELENVIIPKEIACDNLKYITKKQAIYIYKFVRTIPSGVKKILNDSSSSVYDDIKMDYIKNNPSFKTICEIKLPKKIDMLLKSVKFNELGVPIFKSKRDIYICKVFLKRYILSKLYSISKRRIKILEGHHQRLEELHKKHEYERDLQTRKHNRENKEIKIDIDYMKKFMSDKILNEYETEKDVSMKKMLEKLDLEEQYQYNELKEWSLNRNLVAKCAPPRHSTYLRRNLVDSKNIIETTRRGAKKKVVIEDPIPHYMLPCSSVRIDEDVELMEKEWQDKQATLKVDEEPVVKTNSRNKKPNTITVIYEENRVIRDGKMFYIHQNVFCEFRHIGQMMCYMFLINKDECFLRSRLLGDTRIFCVSKKDLETGRVVFKRKASQKKTPKDPNEPSPVKSRAKRGGRTSRGGRGARGRRGASRSRGGRGNRGGRR
ncbi:Hypothetical protein SRAE_X000123200 [Strongyloides ratti]|uniref:Uncharacterized protein n=1 Tax=Strongyloides ratti TaxID=34506 RepID=A0A090KQ25_STRRB|nr:Hypothetical protein SRAE_X000123200 [Strongyloides ratti]CEF59484.1 Hypothetical protein SRAE_X000123200 [Strongyloides ratti]